MDKTPLVRSLVLALVALWGAASLSGMEVVPDTRKIEPLAASTDAPAVAAAQAKILGARAPYATAFPVFILLSEADADIPRKVANLGGWASAIHPRIYAGAIPRDATRYVSNWPGVAYIEAGKRTRPLLDASRPAVKADIVQSGGSGLPASYTGAGSFLGIIDTGLSKNHLDFYVNGNTASPRVSQWFPSQTAAGVDIEWHGTHVAGIAGGNGFSSGGLYTGMAPGANFLIFQSTFQTTDIPVEINTVVGAAATSPVAINLSLGSMLGPHDGSSAFEQSITSIATASGGTNRIIAVAAGNENGGQEHFQTVLSPFGNVSVPLAVATGGTVVDIWADGGDRYTVTGSVTGGTASVSSDQPPNGATHFQVFFSAAVAAPASIQIQRTRNGGSGKIDAYVDMSEGQFSASLSVNAGTTTEPANGDNVIAVGAFNTKLGTSSFGSLGGISSFSSLGPTRDGRRKPDIAAPGAYIYSAKSLDAFDPTAGPPPTTVPTNDNYVIMAGTSMATPHITGIAALVWQSNSSLTGAQMRARLKKTADLPAGVPMPNNTWGTGKVNALRAVSESVASITAPATATPGASVALSSENSSAAFGPSNALSSYAWSLATQPAGSAATLASSAASTTFVPDVPGPYTVALSVSQSTPSGVAAGSDNVALHVNTVPVAAIATPPGSSTIAPATFHASATDPDVAKFGQSIAFHWVLVSRPTGSAATLSPVGTDNATLNPDVGGTYEVGVRADDGLDNSALTVASFFAGPAPSSGGGGGGGCSIAGPGNSDPGAAAGSVLFVLAALAGSLALRRRVRRIG